MFGLAVILYYIMASGPYGIGVNVIGAEWFPRKKGMFMGISTMGITIGGCTINLILNAVIPKFGTKGMFIGYSVFIVLIMVLTQLFVFNTPEEAGAYPDNDMTMTREKVMEIRRIGDEYSRTSQWTVKKVLTYPNTWKIAFGWGMIMMCAAGLMAQIVPALISYGHEATFGIMLMSTLFPVGFFCSWLGGVVDEKYGTKMGSYFAAALLAAGAIIVLLMGSNKVAAGIGTGLMMGAVSAANNMTMSITTTCFGRYDFNNAWSVISILTKVITSAGIVLVSIIADVSGSYSMAFAVILVCAVICALIIRWTDDTCVGRTEDEIAAMLQKK